MRQNRQQQMVEDQVRQMGEMVANANAAANAKLSAMATELDELRAELLVYKKIIETTPEEITAFSSSAQTFRRLFHPIPERHVTRIGRKRRASS